MKLIEHLKSLGIKDSFFNYVPHPHIKSKDYATYYSKIGFYKNELGFISSNILSKVFIGKKFISFKEAFPVKKNFSMVIPSIDPIRATDPVMESFSFEGESFEKAIDSRKKALVDLDRKSNNENNDIDEQEYSKILKRNNLIQLKNLNDTVRYFSNDHFYEVFFEHNYENFKLFSFRGRGPVTNDNFFLVKKRLGKKHVNIYYIDTGNLMYVNDFQIIERNDQ